MFSDSQILKAVYDPTILCLVYDISFEDMRSLELGVKKAYGNTLDASQRFRYIQFYLRHKKNSGELSLVDSAVYTKWYGRR